MKISYRQSGGRSQAIVIASAGNIIWTRPVAVQDEDLFQVAKHVRHVEFVGSPDLGKGILACLRKAVTITCRGSESEFLESLLPRAFHMAKKHLRLVAFELCELPRTIEPLHALAVDIKNCTGLMTCSNGRIRYLRCYCPLLEPIDATLVENVGSLYFYGDGGKVDVMEPPSCFETYRSYNVLGPEALKLLNYRPDASLKMTFINLLREDWIAILESRISDLTIDNCLLGESLRLPEDLVNSTIRLLHLDLHPHDYLYAFSELVLSRMKSLEFLYLNNYWAVPDQCMRALAKLPVKNLRFQLSGIEPGVTARFERVKSVTLSYKDSKLQPGLRDVFPNAEVEIVNHMSFWP